MSLGGGNVTSRLPPPNYQHRAKRRTKLLDEAAALAPRTQEGSACGRRTPPLTWTLPSRTLPLLHEPRSTTRTPDPLFILDTLTPLDILFYFCSIKASPRPDATPTVSVVCSSRHTGGECGQGLAACDEAHLKWMEPHHTPPDLAVFSTPPLSHTHSRREPGEGRRLRDGEMLIIRGRQPTRHSIQCVCVCVCVCVCSKILSYFMQVTAQSYQLANCLCSAMGPKKSIVLMQCKCLCWSEQTH